MYNSGEKNVQSHLQEEMKGNVPMCLFHAITKTFVYVSILYLKPSAKPRKCLYSLRKIWRNLTEKINRKQLTHWGQNIHTSRISVKRERYMQEETDPHPSMRQRNKAIIRNYQKVASITVKLYSPFCVCLCQSVCVWLSTGYMSHSHSSNVGHSIIHSHPPRRPQVSSSLAVVIAGICSSFV